MSNPTGQPAFLHLDLLVTGADLLTADARRPLLRDAVLGVAGGRIAWLDTGAPAGAVVAARLHLPGRVITPGFVNPHNHAVLTLVRGVAPGRWAFDPAIGRRTFEGALALAERWRDHPRVYPNLGADAADTCSEPFLREIAAAAQTHDLCVNTHLGQSTVEVERVRAHAIHIPKCNAASGHLAPTPKLAVAGVNLALTTDTQHGDMVELMRWALATARVPQGGVDAGWQPAHVFRMATLGGAQALGLQTEIGSPEVGKRADFVAFDFRRPHLVPRIDPLGLLVHNAQGRNVDLVAVDGEVLVRDGRPTRVDPDEICVQAEQAARALWGAAGRRYWDRA